MSTTCFVLGHGLGVRMHPETGGASKGLLALDAATTILSNLVDACRDNGLDPSVTCRPTDADLVTRTVGAPVVLRRPSGYIVDVASLSEGLDDVLVIDCDIVAAPSDLRRAIGQLLAATSECALSVARLPTSDDPRSIRPVTMDGLIVGVSYDPAVPRTTGLYRFRGDALDEIRAFVADAAGTFHDLIDEWARQRRQAHLVHLEVAHNVNWPRDLRVARIWWQELQSATMLKGGPSVAS